jgi:geranylgeranyl diphosphate synthase type II
MLNHFLSQVRDRVSKNIEFVIGNSNHIEQAMNYSALSESKMIRAALIFASADTHNFLKNESKVTLATSVELIHTYSLIHDDLPAMDNDDFRRGKKSNHIVFGEADAILSGDALQALAYEIIAEDNNLSDESKIRAIKMLSKACGKNGMVLGQHLDIKSESKDISQMEIENIHSLKTGKLIECAVMLGQLENTSSKETIFKSFGRNIGLAFQIIDDYLEATSSSKKLGKDINSDEKNKKSTYINVLGIDKSLERSEELAKSAIDELNSEKISNSEMLIELARYITKREK